MEDSLGGPKENDVQQAMFRHSYCLRENHLFHRSPEVRLWTDDEKLISVVQSEIEQCRLCHWDESYCWNVFQRKASQEQKEGHIFRLRKVTFLERILMWAERSIVTNYEVLFSGQVCVCFLLL